MSRYTTHLVADVDFHNSAGNIRNGGVLPSAREDGSGRVYVVWADCRFERAARPTTWC